MTVQCVLCKHVLHEAERYKVIRGLAVCMLCCIELAGLEVVHEVGER